jgi:hypothetical protein
MINNVICKNKIMKKTIYHTSLVAVVSVLMLITISSGLPAKKNGTNKNTNRGFVIMELFTSQGCSSCPPADEILATYARKNDEHIIPLAFHVDYWNRLGWIDLFSKNVYSQRQRDYAEKLNTESVYTPQLIINGETEMVGSNKTEIAEKLDSYLNRKTEGKIEISKINIIDKKVKIDYAICNLSLDMVINAALVQINVTTNIMAGENRGVKLENYSVVRDFKTQKLTGLPGSFTLDLPLGNNADNYMVVLFAQNKINGNIKAAVNKKL